MADRAAKRLTVEEFLDWSDRTDTRHMLVDGLIVAMAPASQTHSVVAANAIFELRRRAPAGCRVLSEAGLALAADTCVLADAALTCEPTSDKRLISSPVLIVEVLSPSTLREDLGVKLLGYQELSSVREIWAIDSAARSVRQWRRTTDGWLQTLPVRSGRFHSEVLAAEIAVDELYAGTGL